MIGGGLVRARLEGEGYRVELCATGGEGLAAFDEALHDIVIIDYRVRGFTRDVKGTKHYIDHKINSVQNFVDKNTLTRYQAMDVNVYQENIFHTKMMLKDSKLDNYLFGVRETDLSPPETKVVTQRLRHEMAEIFYGANMVRVS